MYLLRCCLPKYWQRYKYLSSLVDFLFSFLHIETLLKLATEFCFTVVLFSTCETTWVFPRSFNALMNWSNRCIRRPAQERNQRERVRRGSHVSTLRTLLVFIESERRKEKRKMNKNFDWHLFCGCLRAEAARWLSRSAALIAGGHYLNHPPPPPLDSGAKCGCDNDEGERLRGREQAAARGNEEERRWG